MKRQKLSKILRITQPNFQHYIIKKIEAQAQKCFFIKKTM